MQMHVHRSIMMIMGYLFLVLMLLGNGAIANAQLSTGFYSRSCPHLPHIVKSQVHSALSREARMGASILRLFFHDCFVNGCEASLLLDDTPTMIGEKTAAPNNNSVRGFEVIDSIKSAVERACPRVVSCADILAIAAKDSVHLLGGPNWDVKLGRRDARTASFTAANTNLPPPSFNLTQLIHRFQQFNLSPRDMVALSGAHTIGQAQCVNFRNHIYNGTNIDPSFAAIRQSNCPRPSGSGDANLAPLDLQTPNRFDNAYYQNLVQKKGLLNSDQVLFNNDSTDSIVAGYAANPSSFNSDFVAAMIKMGDISPLTGSNGEIRINCRRVN